MPKGHKPKREGKKPKRKDDKNLATMLPVFTSADVEVVKKRRKPKEEE